ncbi:MAG: hypothetical protein ACU0AT_07315 [Tranquillimonas sp.]
MKKTIFLTAAAILAASLASPGFAHSHNQHESPSEGHSGGNDGHNVGGGHNGGGGHHHGR